MHIRPELELELIQSQMAQKPMPYQNQTSDMILTIKNQNLSLALCPTLLK